MEYFRKAKSKISTEVLRRQIIQFSSSACSQEMHSQLIQDSSFTFQLRNGDQNHTKTQHHITYPLNLHIEITNLISTLSRLCV